MEQARVAAELLLGAADPLDQLLETVANRRESQRGRESLPGVVRHRVVPALVDRLAREGGELAILHRAPGDADDDEAPGHQARLGEVEDAGEQLSPGEVAGRPEEDDHVIVGDRRHRGGGGRLCGLDAHRDKSDAVATPTASVAIFKRLKASG